MKPKPLAIELLNKLENLAPDEYILMDVNLISDLKSKLRTVLHEKLFYSLDMKLYGQIKRDLDEKNH